MFTYDPDTTIGKIRLLCTDTDPESFIFADKEISGFLAITEVGGETDVRLAAAEALETIAASEALVQKKMRVLDVSTDGPAVAQSLMTRASNLRRAVETEVSVDVIEMNLDAFSHRDLFFNRRY